MRVLQVDSGRQWRGGQNQVWLLCRELARRSDIEQALVTSRGGELAQRAARSGITVHGTTWEIGLDPRAWWHLRRTIATFQPDVVHVHDSHALTLAATGAMGRGRGRGRGRTIVATRRVEFHIGRFGAWRRAHRIIAISEAVKRILVHDGIASDAVVVVYDGIDVDEVRRAATPPLEIRRQLSIPAGAPLAVNAAALTGEKDHRTLIRAAHYARVLRPDLHWVIAGEGKLRDELTAEIARLELRDRVHLVGHVDRVDALIAAAGVFVLSSRSEGLGSVLLHALALGRPVVATAAGGIPEILPPEVLVAVEAAEPLAQKVVDMLDHPTAVALPDRFSAGAMARGVLDVYRTLL